MKKIAIAFVFLFFYSLVILRAQKVVIVIIDGARYSETFGDPDHSYIPEMWSIAQEGTYIDAFYNDETTYTSAAIPAIWCGDWTETVDTFYQGGNTQYTIQPSIFEYYRKQKNIPSQRCVYSLKHVPSLWLQSFHPEYGPAYWPNVMSDGENDADVLQNTLYYMEDFHPTFMLVYFADVDHAGHSGNWNSYLNAIATADGKVGALWSAIQSDPFYKDQTTMLVTNDHGRHDDAHGGFKGHGDGCNGCRQIMLLAAGPNIKAGYVSQEYGRIPDVAVTAASILDVDMEYASGNVLHDIFQVSSTTDPKDSFNWKADHFGIRIELLKTSSVSLEVFDLQGQKVGVLLNNKIIENSYSIGPEWNDGFNPGVYILNLKTEEEISSKKVMVY